MEQYGKKITMRNSTKYKFFLFLIAIGFVGVVQAQIDRKNNIKQVEEIKPFNINEYKQWQKINLGEISFYASKEIKIGKRQGIDSPYWTYTSNDLTLSVYAGPYSPKPGGEKRLPSYSDKIVYIDKVLAWVWFYEEEKEQLKYAASARFMFQETKNGITKLSDNRAFTIVLFSRNPNINEVAEKIFASVRFNLNQ